MMHTDAPMKATMASRVLPLLLCVMLVTASIAVYSLAKSYGVENANRDIICQSRKLREENPPETAYERAALANARKNTNDCD